MVKASKASERQSTAWASRATLPETIPTTPFTRLINNTAKNESFAVFNPFFREDCLDKVLDLLRTMLYPNMTLKKKVNPDSHSKILSQGYNVTIDMP